jgi:phospholipase C
MTSIQRRRFLQMTGSAIGATLAGQALPASIRRALAVPANRATGSIRDVEHVVILTQENRSFDHYFGSLRGVRGFSDPRPARLPDEKPVWYQPATMIRTSLYKPRGLPADADYVLPFHIDTHASGDYQDGTDHSWSTGHLAWNHGRYDQWVTQKQDPLTMGYLTREDIPFHYALADAFTVCDSYYSAAHADTAINRIILWSGTADPRNVHGRVPNGPGLAERPNVNGYTWTTYPERLEAHGVSWKVYQGGTGEADSPTDNFTDNSLEFFASYQVREGADPKGPLVRKGVSQHTLKELRDDVVQNRLPQVSWIVAPFKYCEHPDASPVDGAFFISRVLDALTANADSWSRTVLFLNYDENDGLFDHMVPPMPPSANERNRHGMVSEDLLDSLGDEFLDLDVHTSMIHPLIPGADPGGRQPIGLGVRVPMLVISPWTAGGWVCSQTFDHTSVLQFLEARFGVAEPNISAWRRAVCGDLTAAFDFAGSPDVRMPDLRPPGVPRKPDSPITIGDPQSMPVQESGVRPARPLPYAWTVRHRVDADAALAWIEFANTGKAGAAFYVYDGSAPMEAPRRYTVSAGKSVSDCWPLHRGKIACDARIYGPNGYFAHLRDGPFEGHVVTIEVSLRYEPAQRQIVATLSNPGLVDCRCRIVETYAGTPPVERMLAAGASVDSIWNVDASQGWYDLSVTIDESAHYLRRFAGHMEYGEPGTSDPRRALPTEPQNG